MAKSKNEGKVKKEGLFKRIGKILKRKSNEAQKATLILFILILLSIITGIIGGYLYQPAKEMYVAESTFHAESRKIYDYSIDSQERTEQITKADEAETVFASVMDKYMTDGNQLIAKYATIHSTFLKLIIAILVVLPFLAIGIMFIGAPINFLFAIANMVIVTPIKIIVYLFNSLRPEKKAKTKTPSHMQLEEAAN